MYKIVAYRVRLDGLEYFCTAGTNKKTGKPFKTCCDFKAFLLEKYPNMTLKICKEKA